ncbi:MAG: SLC45 family MFS transporter [Anaerolineales bacterium]
MEPKRLNYLKTFLLGFGFFGVSVIWATYNAFVPLFLANKFDIRPGVIGFFMTMDNIAALFIQPAVGAWSDRLRTKIGRRLPFILIGAPIAAIAFGIIPLAAVLPVFVACTVTLILSMAVWRTPVVALMPDITPSRFRSQANGVINFMGGVGSIIAFLIGAQLYELNQAYPFWLGSVLVILAAILVFAFIREPKVYEEHPQAERPNLLKSLSSILKDKDKSAIRIFLAIMFWFIAYNAIEAFFTLYANKHLGLPEADGVRLLSQLSLLFVLFALPSGFIGGKIGRRKTISIGILLMAFCMLLMAILPVSFLTNLLFTMPILGEVPVVGIILMLAGIAWAFININSLPMVVDLTDSIHIGTYTGLYYLFSTLAAILGPNINGWLVELAGQQYSVIMFIGPVFMLLALAMMMGVRRGEARIEPTQESN